MADEPRVILPDMCPKHQSLLTHQIRFEPDDPWRALIVVAQVALFQGVTRFPATWDRLGNDVTRLSELGCLACFRPDLFGEVVDAGVKGRRGGGISGTLTAIKELADGWVKAGKLPPTETS